MATVVRAYDFGVSHYEVLGVSPGATAAEIRRAFVAAARRHHPDFHVGASPSERRHNEASMRRINAAWAVLGDPAAKLAYDREVAHRGRADSPTRTARPSHSGAARTASGASVSFRPYDLSDEGDDDPLLIDDTPFDGTEPPPRWMQLLPVALVLVGMALALLGFLISLRELLGAGFVVLALGAVAFLLAPLSVMSRSARNRSAG